MLLSVIMFHTIETYALRTQIHNLDTLTNYLLTHKAKRIILTTYNSLYWQTDNTPYITASSTKTSFQTLALSRDLIRTYNEYAELEYGDTVRIYIKDCLLEDTMNKRYGNCGDLWTDSYVEAIKFGRKEAYIIYKKKGELR
uniref:3D domain-containing protein n=1 Tax=viral metagenome TaxID=1070528 RepID=A0A6H1ZCQ6_9ZZZZ